MDVRARIISNNAKANTLNNLITEEATLILKNRYIIEYSYHCVSIFTEFLSV
jgi:hypothetical protein